MNSNQEADNKYSQVSEDYFGSKYSEFLFPEGKVIETLNTEFYQNERSKTELNKLQFWSNFNQEIRQKYNRPCTLSKYFTIKCILI